MLHCHGRQGAEHTRFVRGFALTDGASLAQRIVHAVGGVVAHRSYPPRVAVEDRPGSRLSREVLDAIQMSATSEHDREAAMPLLIPL
jgi:hypothetical protein